MVTSSIYFCVKSGLISKYLNKEQYKPVNVPSQNNESSMTTLLLSVTISLDTPKLLSFSRNSMAMSSPTLLQGPNNHRGGANKNREHTSETKARNTTE